MKFVPITNEIWEAASQLCPRKKQFPFIRHDVVLHSLARCYVQEERPDKLVPYLILHEGEMIGTFLFRNYGLGCNLTNFFVDRKHQGKGLGRLALQTYIDWLKQITPVPRRSNWPSPPATQPPASSTRVLALNTPARPAARAIYIWNCISRINAPISADTKAPG